jgi:DNA polymerase-3 subunit gamma/tau
LFPSGALLKWLISIIAMSYTVLARRYRSGTFDEVVGQNHIAQTLKKAISSGRIAHAYLFCGTRGTGKTSTARILAKALNCESGKDGPVTEPCGKCSSCLGIARGDDIDVIEIDAASNTGVDNIRELIENSQYRPARSRFKIYIIDEVHMLSKSAFNALLKTLEEPPSHVKFILATTEPEKVLPTILSRCQRYDFRNIPTREIAGHLASICKQEKIDASEDALFLIAKAGAGSMRDALSLLDRLLSLGEKDLTTDMIENLLGLPKSQQLFSLSDAVGRGDVAAVLTQTDGMIQSGLSVDSFLASFIDHLRNLLVLRACGIESNLVEVPGLSLAELNAQAQRFDTVSLAQNIAILEELRRQARQSNAGRALLDASLVRLALTEQFSSVAEMLSQSSGEDSAGPVQKKKFEPVAPPPSPAPPSPPPPNATPAAVIGPPSPPAASAPSSIPTPSAPMDFDLGEDDDALPSVGKVWDDGPKLSLSTIMAQAKQKAAAAPPPMAAAESPLSNIEAVDPTSLSATYKAMIDLVAKHGASLPGLLSPGRYMGVEDGRAVIRFSPDQESLLQLLDKKTKRDLIVSAFSEVLQQPVGVKFELDAVAPLPTSAPLTTASNGAAAAASRPSSRAATPPPPEAPAAPSIRLTPELRAELEQDPLIRSILELGGTIVKVE